MANEAVQVKAQQADETSNFKARVLAHASQQLMDDKRRNAKEPSLILFGSRFIMFPEQTDGFLGP